MPNNSFSVGHDVSIDIFDTVAGKMVTFPLVTGFHAKPTTKQISSEPLNGPPITIENPNGWSGSLTLDRTDNSVDLWFADRESRYFAGQSIFNVSITQTIKEANGTVTQFRFDNVGLKLDDAGNWQASAKITMSISWVASSRRRVL